MKLKALLQGFMLSLAFASSSTFAASASETKCEGKKITVFGDSLTAGYGLDPGQGFPEQLQRQLDEKGYKVTIVNAGVSGDTTSGGLARLDWSLGEGTDAVILELGANDALRGISPKVTRKNLDAMVTMLKQKNIDVLLAGMLAPPNMGTAFAEDFNALYPELAEKHDIMLYPFFLDGVAANEALNQADGIHPTKEGIAVIVDNFLPDAEKLIAEICK